MHVKRALLYPALVSAVAVSLVLIPSASTNNGDPLIVGVNTNTATASTFFNTTGAIGLVVNDATAGATALMGNATALTGSGVGVDGESSSSGLGAAGVYGQLSTLTPAVGTGTSTSAGVRGVSQSQTANGPGVYGLHSSSAGTGPAVLGETASTAQLAVGMQGVVTSSAAGLASAGVRGLNNGTVDAGVGVWGQTAAAGFGVFGVTPTGGAGVAGLTTSGVNLGYGVLGQSNSTADNAAGVSGVINSNAANAAGVRGYNAHANCCGMGVAGFHAGQGIGVYGEANNGFAVSGYSPNNWSGYFQGSVNVVGTLTKTAGAFRIDNPLDPAHSYLQHSFVESPDMKNVYDGVVRTNGKGFATVKLPDWFDALNKYFRYQLTSLSGLQLVAVAKEISHNRFTIQSQKPNSKVSWQVTGIRKDRYANAHRIQTVVPKTGSADNKYVHPELYGKPPSKSVVVLPGMTPATRAKFTSPRLPVGK